MNILSASNLSKTHGLKPLFSDLSFGIEDRDRIGLIGVNGCGKSTLLQVLAGMEPADSGDVTMRQGLRVEYMSQNPVFAAGLSVIDHIFSASDRISPVVRRYEMICARMVRSSDDPALLRDFEEASAQMDACSAWQYEARARAVLGKLGVTDMEAAVTGLSGGYRRRVALAHALLAGADLLMLDEPTNHLDADTVAWLEDYLRRFSGAVVLVTHDRYFLDRVATRIIELDGGRIHTYEGNFSYYLERKAERESAAATVEQRRQAILRKELEWLKRGARARTTKQKARIDRIHGLEQDRPDDRRASVSFTIESRRMGNTILELDKVTKSFGSLALIRDFSYTFRPGERLGVVGPNGSGKTTLANLIVGRCQPDSGNVKTGQTVVFGYFDQESAELDPAERAIDYVTREGGDMLRGTDGSVLSAALVMEQFFFTSQMLYTPIARLSGGERRRLYLVRTLMRNPNFLVLDEPANDLDIPTLQALEDFLDGFTGCLVVISHDRYFLDRTVDHLLSFEEGGTLRTYPGNYAVYERMRAEIEPEPVSQTGPRSPGRTVSASTKLGFNEARELAALEKRIPEMEHRLKELEAEMVEAATEYQRLQLLSAEQRQLASDLAAAIDRWAELAERV